MARLPRIEYERAFYRISSRGNERRRVFSRKSGFERFKKYLKVSTKIKKLMEKLGGAYYVRVGIGISL